MHPSLLGRLAGALTVALGLLPGVVHADLAQDYARGPAVQTARLSPSGRYLAMLTGSPTGAPDLTVIDLETGARTRSESNDPLTVIDELAWINDDRLLVSAWDRGLGVYVTEGRAGSYAVNRDGNLFRELIRWRRANDTTSTRIANRTLTYEWQTAGVVRDGGADIWVRKAQHNAQGDWTGYSYGRLNTLDGTLSTVSLGAPEHVSHWVRSADGRVQAVVSQWDGRQQLRLRTEPDGPWRLLNDAGQFGEDPWWPVAFLNNQELMVLANAGQDTEGLHVLQLASGKLAAEPLVAVKGFDLGGSVITDGPDGALLGVRLRADAPMTVWFDRQMDQIQRSVDQALPKGRTNRLSCERCSQSRFVLIWSSSDQQPGEYYVYDKQKLALRRVEASRPWLDESRQGRRSFHTVKTRDGLNMPVFVTHPAGVKPDQPLPAVVLVHGGPYVRGTDLQWHAEAQYLAALGYRVIEPEYRGSTGFGQAWQMAGRQAWGRAMQDDLLDALQWAVDRRWVDSSRVCIMGSSYGGYASLMGAVRDGAHYRCAISFAGVTDIGLMRSIIHSDFSEQTKDFYLRNMVELPSAEAQAAVSPLRRVAELRTPVLLMHGVADRRVPIKHAQDFVSAAKSAGAPVEYVTYNDEGHGFTNPANKADYLRRVGAFLQRHLGEPAAAASAAR